MNIREEKTPKHPFRAAGLKPGSFHREKYFSKTFRMEMALKGVLHRAAGRPSELGTKASTAAFIMSCTIYYR